jgi:hypothetical protein
MTSRIARNALILCLVAPLTSCGFFAPKPPPKATIVMYEWNDDNGPGDLKIEIDLSKQVATYKRQDRVIGWSFVCTGKQGHSTRTGDYKITEKCLSNTRADTAGSQMT